MGQGMPARGMQGEIQLAESTHLPSKMYYLQLHFPAWDNNLRTAHVFGLGSAVLVFISQAQASVTVLISKPVHTACGAAQMWC